MKPWVTWSLQQHCLHSFPDHQHMAKRLKQPNIQNQCSWRDLDDKAIFDCLSLSFELCTKPKGTFRLVLEARGFFILSQWVPAHDLDTE